VLPIVYLLGGTCKTLGAGEAMVVLGHSMGARVAMRMAADYPGEIRACVLEDMDARVRGPDTAYDELTSIKLDYLGARAFDPVGPSVADVAARLSAAMPLVFNAERVGGYVVGRCKWTPTNPS